MRTAFGRGALLAATILAGSTSVQAKEEFWFRLSGQCFGGATGLCASAGGSIGDGSGGGTNTGGTDPGGSGDQDPNDDPTPDVEDETDSGQVRFLSVSEPDTKSGGATFAGRVALAGGTMPAEVTWDPALMRRYLVANQRIVQPAASSSDDGRGMDYAWTYDDYVKDQNGDYVFEPDGMPRMGTVRCSLRMDLSPTGDPNVWTYVVRRTEGSTEECGGIGVVGMRATDGGGGRDAWLSNYAIDHSETERDTISLVGDRTIGFDPASGRGSLPLRVLGDDGEATDATLVFAASDGSRASKCGPDGRRLCTVSAAAGATEAAMTIRNEKGNSTRVVMRLNRNSQGRWTIDAERSGPDKLDWIEPMIVLASTPDGPDTIGGRARTGSAMPAYAVDEEGELPIEVADDGSLRPDDAGTRVGSEYTKSGPFFDKDVVKSRSTELAVRFLEEFHEKTNQVTYTHYAPEDQQYRYGEDRRNGYRVAKPRDIGYEIVRQNAPFAYAADASEVDADGWFRMTPMSGPDAEGFYSYDPSFGVEFLPYNDYGDIPGQKCWVSYARVGDMMLHAEFAELRAKTNPRKILKGGGARYNLDQSRRLGMPCVY